MPERVRHYEDYQEKFSFVKCPGLVDKGYFRDCEVSKKFRANYTSIITIDLKGEIVYRKDFPNNFGNAYSGLDSKIQDLLDDIDTQAPETKLNAPSGGEQLKSGDTFEVKWNATDNVGVVSRAIYFTKDGGSNYELVDSSSGNSGSYDWTVPNVTANDCKIKVYAYDAMGNVGNDESGVFSIGQTSIVHNVAGATKSIRVRKLANSYELYMPFAGNYSVTVTDVSGKLLSSFTTAKGVGWYAIPAGLTSGMHIINIRTPGKTIVKKVWHMR